MSTQKLRQIRCRQCNHWTNGHLDTCEHCGFEIKKAHREEIAIRRQMDDFHIPIWRTTPKDPWWLLVIKRPVQLVQLVLYAIVASLIYFGSSFAH